mmetsp:Transcript_14058/g.30435  ORF Transcript_14058/g.30435 Transcript_14058/m.30435 type:complete len:668 (+) Transcript_14058:557-2560(+)|eukprot:CAMPEP_0202898260 /NCGR_PEP_ID=MMETSP1392-20130828/6819_1 /ASSEMBLY_ACC=CAM_ASM_000868 /TAXON_ID=225041 /ORGANISM="Chlamydomonas chlamydogama, Strain SAG 11-48b" /LENGTH=667 /DNA_ID=CAMNT_0049584131 /DNA_START=494 /DNA_END=2497 /DNA_ORIENTATION=+
MGCFHSKEVLYEIDGKPVKDEPTNYHISPEVEQALQSARLSQLSQQHIQRGSGNSISFPLTPSTTGRNNRPRKSYVGADLHSIMDDQGMLNPLVSRQLSVMSHYSVRSESGSVMITPEEGGPPFRLLRLIGRGGFGNVYLGEWEAQRVAIKVIQGNTQSEQPEEQEWEVRKERMAQMEAILMSAINHPNIVNTLKVLSHSGEQVDPELAAIERQLLRNYTGGQAGGDGEGLPSFEWHIIMEYCDKGSLSKALSTFMFHEPADTQTCRWDVWASLETLKEITRALMFMHENRILHGDLKAANVLLISSHQDRRNFLAKVSDFGLSRVLQANKNHIKTQTFGTVTHVPPELLAKGTLSPSADVYAVGVLMWEIYTAEKVFKQLSDSEVILAVVTKKARPTFPSDVPPKYKFLAERCWAEMPELRPSLEQLMNELDNLQTSLCPQGEHSSPIPCKVYPTRQKALAELYQKQQQMAAMAAQGLGPSSPPGTSNSGGLPAGAMVARSGPSLSRLANTRRSQELDAMYSQSSHYGTGPLQVAPRTASYNPMSSPQVRMMPRTNSFVSRMQTVSNSGMPRVPSPLAPQHMGRAAGAPHPGELSPSKLRRKSQPDTPDSPTNGSSAGGSVGGGSTGGHGSPAMLVSSVAPSSAFRPSPKQERMSPLRQVKFADGV